MLAIIPRCKQCNKIPKHLEAIPHLQSIDFKSLIMSTNDDKTVLEQHQQHLDYDDGQCAICLSPQTCKSRLICGHVFCYKCILVWTKFKFECPLCKQRFNSFATTNLDYKASDIHTVLNMPIYQLGEESQQHQEIPPLVFTLCIDGSTTDLFQFLSNKVEFMSNIAMAYGAQLPDNRNVWDFIFKNVPPEIYCHLVASFEQTGTRIG